MRIPFFALLAGCASTSASTRPEAPTAATHFTHASPLPILVPDDAASVVFLVAPISLTVVGDDFDTTTQLRAISCMDLPDGTRVVSWRASTEVEMQFSTSHCVDARIPRPGPGGGNY